MLFKHVRALSKDARADRRALDDNNEASIHWAAPLDRLDRPGHFWAFFPTMTASPVPGILNAPWKTNEDRQNLLRGPYNDEPIEAAAKLIAESLPALATVEDPARHLDALPRRQEAGDSEQSVRLREHLVEQLRDREIVPDQEGALRPAASLKYPPGKVSEAALARWSQYPNRPSDWLHSKAVTRNRLAAIDRLFPERRARYSTVSGVSGAPRASVSQWLEALQDSCGGDAVGASRAAIRTAALLDPAVRGRCLGRVVLTSSGEWLEPDPERVFLPDGDAADDPDSASLVHPALAADEETLKALKTLGIEPASPESRFRLLAERLSGEEEPESGLLEAFWQVSRQIDPKTALKIVERQEPVGICPLNKPRFWSRIRARTRTGEWRPLHALVLPGSIADGCSEDDGVVLDVTFHEKDCSLLRWLGATDAPHGECDLQRESWSSGFLSDCRRKFYTRLNPERPQPREPYLIFDSWSGTGPLEVMESLSEESRARFTDALLELDKTYECWVMRHETRRKVYPTVKYLSPALKMLREHGRIRVPGDIVPFGAALGKQPENRAAWRALREHPKAEKIGKAFDLADLTPDSFGKPDVAGEEEPVPLLDEWPGLEGYLPEARKHGRLIRCERILAGDMEWPCFPHGSDIYLVRAAEEGRALDLVAKALKLGLGETEIARILRRETPGEIRARREKVKRQGTDAARLLAAVGKDALRSKLPGSLLAILEKHEGRLTELRVAEAAVATWHTDALRRYRGDLGHLDPPRQWAGSSRAVAFVQALGFSEEWAGERGGKRPAFEEVNGPLTLPKLHPYQRKVVERTRALFRESRPPGGRRGMISMPTGSGKTRVAAQAVVEALREGELAGGVLWVADRDELCEQAVEAWGEVWASEGTQTARLRISRLWQGQANPLPTGERHVVVASVQTLAARFRSKPDDYAFLADFALVVFDEAHRSIAPTYTEVMEELGMAGRRRRPGEPFLVGLTATPYRGRNERETEWLARRYGRIRLDAGAFRSGDPHKVVAELQEMKVLAEADQREIDGGALKLSDYERRQAEAAPWLPQSAENRIARDTDRTTRIVEAFETHIGPDWPTLIFATSVEHAQTLAALLSGRGVAARAVSGETESRTRRRIVEEFRNGAIRALVNYGVFREGFDAPRTRAIIVARPVYSPNLYFQTIGRGLRGAKNGGNDRCLILNVRDNIRNYDRRLAFSDLDWLWRGR